MRGGARQGAGRPKGSANKMSQKAREEAAAVGLLPHEFLAAIARGEMIGDHQPTFEERMDAAKAAAPFYAPRLASTQVTASITRSHEDMLDELDREAEEIIVARH